MPDKEKVVKEKVKLKYVVPKTLGAAIDLLMKVRTARKVVQSKAEAEKQQEDLIELRIMEKFGKSELEGARGKIAQCSIKRSDVPTFDDWERFAKHIEKHPEDVTLLQRRLSVEACRERWAAKQAIPGVGLYTRVTLNLTKVK